MVVQGVAVLSEKKKENGENHKCKWGAGKQEARCQSQGCEYAAALCPDHKGVLNCTSALLDWLPQNNVTTNVFSIGTPLSSPIEKGC